MSYGRAFTRSDGYGYLPKDMLELYDPAELKLHVSLLAQRHQIYAHSDSASYPIRPWKSDWHTDMTLYTVLELPFDDIRMLQGMCSKISNACRLQQRAIKAKYI